MVTFTTLTVISNALYPARLQQSVIYIENSLPVSRHTAAVPIDTGTKTVLNNNF